ncbi:hypothetical protein COU61_01945 [Candidatus Pacearchaeota archaeon CG10_big_fil_rev_8_21_14_0_10_35_13]|nr:MAG: hypothetical protein COU61_01945 [Candidatus Pacearchaeota archaeon CG10_big_fil_rev_8_21_14_0_10_35_13]
MKRSESVLRELLFQAVELKNFGFSQLELSKKLGLSLSIINSVIKRLESMGAVIISPQGFKIVDSVKILYYWSSLRNLDKDIVFMIRIDSSVSNIEKLMPGGALFTAFTAYKLKYNDVPSDYSSVFIYADDKTLDVIKSRISKLKTSVGNPNFFVLKFDPLLTIYKSIPSSQVFVDLWNIKGWQAKEFFNALTKRMNLSEAN